MTEKKENTQYSPWMPITDIRTLRVLGKAAEETAELNKALARAIIQGLDGIDPHTGKDNKTAILEEIVDVFVSTELVVDLLDPDLRCSVWMTERQHNKFRKLKEWQEGLLDE